MPALSAEALLHWYHRTKRSLPWRGESDPYRIWLSEVMLQQTTVAAVGPRYARFLARFPDIGALAAAPWEAVAAEWAGLGYYARARNLHAAAQAVAAQGGFPRDAAGLRTLPGIGAYTAAAVAAIGFQEPVVPADGNVERVMARAFLVETPLPGAKPELARLAQGFMEQTAARAAPGDFAQALFDLGATICTPRNPACALCPWMAGCAARAAGRAGELPRKAEKCARGVLHGVHFLIRDGQGRIGVRARPPRGLFGGMWEIPGTPWRATPWPDAEAMPHAPDARLNWRAAPGEALHQLTHRDLVLRLFMAQAQALPPGLTPLTSPAELPTVMRKLLGLAG
ncbi:MAG: NUDIX domain-containing protein [Alphaproteobacteria bacterium]|nr:NUDIX domain-containing protein [Alphaproteobacteria bacterium]